MNKCKWIANFKLEHALLKFISERGIPRKNIEAINIEFANRKVEKGTDYYYYTGPSDDKTRPFCKKMLSLDKVLTETDIDILSNYLDYDVKKYKGSYNCRHNWVKFRGKIISTPELTIGQIRDLVRKGIKG
jgi:hypothetical protein